MACQVPWFRRPDQSRQPQLAQHSGCAHGSVILSFKIAKRGVACSTLPCFSGGESSQKFKNMSAKPSPEARAKFHLLRPGRRSAERPGPHIAFTQRRALRLESWLCSQRVSQCLSHCSFDFYPFFFFFFLIRGLCSRACLHLTLSVLQLVENKPVWCNHRRSRAFSAEKQNPQRRCTVGI